MAPLSCLAALLVCKWTHAVPVVTWYEVWREYWNQYLGPIGYVGRLIEWLVAKVAPVNVAVSRLAASRLQELGGRAALLIPIGIDVDGIRSVEPAVEECDVIYVGRLISHKNLELLIDSVALLRSRNGEPRVSIVGEGPQMEALVQRARVNGLESIRFLGRVESHEQILSMMKSARVFAFPSTREGFGLAPLEAAACGLPVLAVTHQHNATTELIEDGINGVIASPNPMDFARSLEILLVDEDLRARMGREAKERAESFDWTQIANRTERLYQSCLSPGMAVDARWGSGW